MRRCALSRRKNHDFDFRASGLLTRTFTLNLSSTRLRNTWLYPYVQTHNGLNQKNRKNNERCFDGRGGFSRSSVAVSGSYPRTHVSSPVTIIYFVKFGSLEIRFFSTEHTSTRCSFCSSVNNFGTQILRTLFSHPIHPIQSNDKYQLVRQLHWLLLWRSSVLSNFVSNKSNGIVCFRPGRWSSSMDTRPSSKRLNRSNVTQRPSETSPKANLIDSKVSVAFLPILKRNVIHAP